MNDLKKQIEALNIGESIKIEYKLRDYKIKCYNQSSRTKKKIFGINLIDGVRWKEIMNVDKITNKYISFYSYNIFSQQTKYKMKIENVIILKN